MIGSWLALAAAPRVLAAEPRVQTAAMDDAVAWPAATRVSRPWTRWWWLGSAVDAENLTRLMETYHAAGLGGVEITCIYGVRGAEDRELPYLSAAWVDAVRHVVREAKRLGMGVDLPTGSGWRTGGPSVTDEDANAEVVIEHEALEGGSDFKWTFDQVPPEALVAYGAGRPDRGPRRADSRSRVDGDLGHVEWQVPGRKLDALLRHAALVAGQREASGPRRRG